MTEVADRDGAVGFGVEGLGDPLLIVFGERLKLVVEEGLFLHDEGFESSVELVVGAPGGS